MPAGDSPGTAKETAVSEFKEFPKMARLSRDCVITEKIDGTNAQILILSTTEVSEVDKEKMVWGDGGTAILAGSRTRWITPKDDNYGFAKWVSEMAPWLLHLGPGRHFGEWWGAGIQRGYGVATKRWSLFNVGRWHLYGEEPRAIPTQDPRVTKTTQELPSCCGLVPILYSGMFTTRAVETALAELQNLGSAAAPGFMKPEGVVCFHTAANFGFKKTIEKDEVPKGLQKKETP